MIKLLKRSQINTDLWNSRIADSTYETIYPYTWYLDACAENWCGFAMDDYEYIMPVVYRKKLGLKYSYNPVFCQQLGVFSHNEISSEILYRFMDTFSRYFKAGEYAINSGNKILTESNYELTENKNFVLDITPDYFTLSGNYSTNCRRNLKRTEKFHLEHSQNVTVDEVVALKRHEEKNRRGEERYVYIKQLFSRLKEMGRIQVHGIKSDEQLIAAAVFALSRNRAVYLLSVSSEEGKEQRAMFYLVDEFIRINSGKIDLLDFEGSNISSISRFFEGFGAMPEVYQRIRFKTTINKIIRLVKNA